MSMAVASWHVFVRACMNMYVLQRGACLHVTERERERGGVGASRFVAECNLVVCSVVRYHQNVNFVLTSENYASSHK